MATYSARMFFSNIKWTYGVQRCYKKVVSHIGRKQLNVLLLLLLFLVIYTLFIYAPAEVAYKDFSRPCYYNFHNISRQNFNGKKLKKNMVLSYTIFGKDSGARWGHLIGMVATEAFKSNLYNNWILRIYHDKTLSEKCIQNYVSNFGNLEFIDVTQTTLYGDISSINGRVWRFLPLADNSVDTVCFRDLDSPILKREEHAVAEWLSTNHIVHVMRDHYWHETEILAGLWGFRSVMNRTFAQKVVNIIMLNAQRRSAKQEAIKLNDQIVLTQYIWPLLKSSSLQHDSYTCNVYNDTTPFPTKRADDFRYVGCIRPCVVTERVPCDVSCRPGSHLDWTYC